MLTNHSAYNQNQGKFENAFDALTCKPVDRRYSQRKPLVVVRNKF